MYPSPHLSKVSKTYFLPVTLVGSAKSVLSTQFVLFKNSLLSSSIPYLFSLYSYIILLYYLTFYLLDQVHLSL